MSAAAAHMADGSFHFDPLKTGRELLQSWIDSGTDAGGFPQRLRSRPVELSEGYVRMVCDIDPAHSNFVGLVHGGVTASLIDMAAGGAVMTVLEAGQGLLSTELSMRFLNAAPINCRQLEVAGTIRYRDARKAVVEGVVTTPDGTIVAQGTVGVVIRPMR